MTSTPRSRPSAGRAARPSTSVGAVAAGEGPVSASPRAGLSCLALLAALLSPRSRCRATPALDPSVAGAAECAGDECQVPPPAPEDPIPGTAVVEGPPNQPVHYPKVHKKNPHTKNSRKRHRHRGSTVRAAGLGSQLVLAAGVCLRRPASGPGGVRRRRPHRLGPQGRLHTRYPGRHAPRHLPCAPRSRNRIRRRPASRPEFCASAELSRQPGSDRRMRRHRIRHPPLLPL